MYFMVDLENTGSRGLQGAEYLTAEDSITLFYSEACKRIERGRLQQMKDSGSRLDICRLQNSGKNALDFYIASRIGETYGAGYEGTTVVISNDKGFRAVQDYWRSCAVCQKRIILKPDIEQGILASNESSERKRVIQKKLQEVDLQAEYKKHEEHMRIRRELEERFADTEYAGMVEQILLVVEGRKAHKVLYLDSLKRFGRKDGVEIYRRIRQMV